jgi:hypothetical protein
LGHHSTIIKKGVEVIIGLSGYAQSGKDSVAQILVDNHGYRRIAFADKIKEFLYEVNPTLLFNAGWGDKSIKLQTVVDTYGWDQAKQSDNIRSLLQTTGVAARSTLGENIWVNAALSGASQNENIVITDVRFENEAQMITYASPNDSQIWRIKRPGVEPVNAHVSETQMDGYKVDQILINNGTLEDLEALIKSRIAGILI